MIQWLATHTPSPVQEGLTQASNSINICRLKVCFFEHVLTVLDCLGLDCDLLAADQSHWCFLYDLFVILRSYHCLPLDRQDCPP